MIFLGPWYYVGKHARKSLTTLSKEIFLANSEIIIVNEPPFGQLNIRPTVILQETKIFFNIFLARSFLFASDFESRYSAEIFFPITSSHAKEGHHKSLLSLVESQECVFLRF